MRAEMAWQAEVKPHSAVIFRFPRHVLCAPPPSPGGRVASSKIISKKLLFAGEVENGESGREYVASNKSEGRCNTRRRIKERRD